MDKIFLGKKLVAIHMRQFPQSEGTIPFSSHDGALQCMTMKRPKGHIAHAHRHIPKKRVTRLLQECLVVLKGKVRFDLFDRSKKCFRRVVVRPGEAMLILDVPHALHFLEDSLAFELKNGPYIDDKKLL